MGPAVAEAHEQHLGRGRAAVASRRVPTAVIHSADQHSSLTVGIEPDRSGFDSRWHVTLETPDVSATHGFWSGVEPVALAEFFDDLARDWRGWTGDKVFTSVEHDLVFRATHDGSGHVLLGVRLGTHVAEDAKSWQVSAPLALEAGQLEPLATSVRRLLTAS
jgi:hypothetical protein